MARGSSAVPPIANIDDWGAASIDDEHLTLHEFRYGLSSSEDAAWSAFDFNERDPANDDRTGYMGYRGTPSSRQGATLSRGKHEERREHIVPIHDGDGKVIGMYDRINHKLNGVPLSRTAEMIW